MTSSFSILNSHIENQSLLIVSDLIADRANLLLDLIKHARESRVYIVCDYKPTLSDKLEELCSNKTIIYIDSIDYRIKYVKECLIVFYEGGSYQSSEIRQAAMYNRVVVSAKHKEFLSTDWMGLTKMSINKSKENQYNFKVFSREVTWVCVHEKPIVFKEYCYFIENSTIKKILSSYFEVGITKDIKLINYFPESVDIFSSPQNFRSYLRSNGINSYRIYKKILGKTIQEKENTVIFNFAYILILNNFIKIYEHINLDIFDKILDVDFANHLFRGPHYSFLKYLPQGKMAQFLRKSNLKELYLLEMIEMDLKNVAKEGKIPFSTHKIKTFKQLKEKLDFITYKSLENKNLPSNKFHELNNPYLFSPRTLHELYEMKFFFKNCITLYLENILYQKSIFAKIKHKGDWFCVCMDMNYQIQDIKKTLNQEVEVEKAREIQSIINLQVLGKQTFWQIICGLL